MHIFGKYNVLTNIVLYFNSLANKATKQYSEKVFVFLSFFLSFVRRFIYNLFDSIVRETKILLASVSPLEISNFIICPLVPLMPKII